MKKNKVFRFKLIICFFLILVFGVLCYTYVVPPGKDYQYESDFLKNYSTDFVKVNDTKIHYLKMGQGEPLVLIHGGGAWLYTFRNNIEELSKHYTIYALDMPGQKTEDLSSENDSCYGVYKDKNYIYVTFKR